METQGIDNACKFIKNQKNFTNLPEHLNKPAFQAKLQLNFHGYLNQQDMDIPLKAAKQR